MRKLSVFLILIMHQCLTSGCYKPAGLLAKADMDTATAAYTYNGPGKVVVHSPKSSGIYRGTPSITKLPNGHIITSNDIFGTGVSIRTDIFRSTDSGSTWSQIGTVNGATWSGLFYHNNLLYLLGADNSSGANLVIRSSADEGATWSAPAIIRAGACHGSATPVVIAGGRIYKAYEFHDVDPRPGKWMSGNKSYMISAPVNADLMNAASWSVSNAIIKPEWLDGTGWLETNAVLGRDGKIKGISRLASMEGIYAGYYSLSSSNQVEADSARKIPFWGGASKFSIKFDSVTNKYWSLTNYAPDTLKVGDISAGGIRSVLALTCSDNLEDWNIKAIVLADMDVEYVGFQYVDWIIDGNDILFASRTAYDDGVGGPDNYHNSNFMTFHRIQNFSSASTPSQWQFLLPDSGWNGKVVPIDESGGKGSTELNPVLISHPGQLVYLSEQVYQGNSFSGKYFKMTNNIDLNGFNFLPIGWYINTTTNKPFSGHFNGNGFAVLNLKINRNDDTYTSNGLFGFIKNGSVSNLGITGNSYMNTGSVCAGIAAFANASTITKCYNSSNIKASAQAGGIVGYGTGAPVINNCYNKGTVYVNSSTATNRYSGGIIGFYSTGTVSNCYNTGLVSALFSGSTGKGGVSGSYNTNWTNCYYLQGSVPEGNGTGTMISTTDLQSSATVSLLNNGQSPAPWGADINGINNGYPVLQ